jgi:beta-lactamase regulating signal transducer with metallopeptidase domain
MRIVFSCFEQEGSFSSFLICLEKENPTMKSFNLTNLVRAIALALSLGLAPFALNALAQNTSTTTTTQSNPPAQSSSTTSTTKQTQSETTTTAGNPLLWIIGGIALLAILLIVILSSRGRSRNSDATVYESKTVVKKE